MEPLEWGLLGLGALLGKQILETTSDTLTKESLKVILPEIKSALANIPDSLRSRLSVLGDRAQRRLPADEDPVENPILLAEAVEAEADDPEIAAIIEEVQAQLPPIDIKIDRRKQQGIVINDRATVNFNEKIEQNFS